jgi:hypothetical protein
LQTQILVVTKGSRIDDKNLSPEGAHKAFQTIDDWAMANKIVHLLVRFNADDCSTAMNVLTVAMARVISSLDRNDKARSTWIEEDLAEMLPDMVLRFDQEAANRRYN